MPPDATDPRPPTNGSAATADDRAAPDRPASGPDRPVPADAASPPALTFGDAWDYDPAPESHPIEIPDQLTHFIDGSFIRPAAKTEWAPTVNPATEAELARVAVGGEKDVAAAVDAARRALRKWSRTDPRERGKYLFRIARRIQERARELAVLESTDNGKPIRESRDVDVPLAAQHFFYYAGWADKLRYAVPGGGGPDGPRPVGVCGQIIPWNFPLLMAAWKIAPALACGNTVVLKPAETTPLTAHRLAEILTECELPPGVVNIVFGEGRTGQAIAAHPGVDKIAFTGSTAVGKSLAATAAERGVPVTLELGGKSPNIIFADAPIDQAIEGVVRGIYFNQGHVCCAGSRLFVEEPVLDDVLRRLRHRMASLRVGDPLDKNTDVGAINSRVQLQTIQRHMKLAQDDGATRVQPAGNPLPDKGYWCRPAFFTDVSPAHRIAREEVFGPVLAVLTFRTAKEAVELANDTTYGLSAGVWTDKGSKVLEVARSLQAGVVWCNTFNKLEAPSPFGGYKESGFGREGGRQGLRPYLRVGP